MNANGKRVRIKEGVFHVASATPLGGKEGAVVKSDDPYFMVEFDEPFPGMTKTQLTLHWSSIDWGRKPQDKS